MCEKTTEQKLAEAEDTIAKQNELIQKMEDEMLRIAQFGFVRSTVEFASLSFDRAECRIIAKLPSTPNI